MKRSFPMFLVVLVLMFSSFPAMADGPRVKEMELPEVAFDRAAHFQQMTSLQQRLSAVMVDLANQAPLVVDIRPDELRGIRDRAAANEQKMKVGIVRELAIPVGFSRERIIPQRATLHETFGAMRGRDDGGFDWTGVVRSAEAAASRVHITDFDLPEGAELYAFARNGMAFGPYTLKGPNGTGEFWTNTIAGSEVFLQLRAPAGASPQFTVAGFGHLTDAFKLARSLAPRPEAGSLPCGDHAPCVVDAACTTEDGTEVAVAKSAVAHMLFISGAYYYICSGGLIADSDTSTNVPYFVTANHCISRGSEASSLETFFFYAATSCGGCSDPYGTPSTNGSSIVASNRTSDYTLLRLSQNAPSSAAFLGWNSTPVANSNNTPLFRISHPAGAPQSYSEHVVDTSKGTCRSWPRGSWIYSRDILGATEGGSSGSPVVNAAGQLVGQLSGGCGFNVNDECDTASNATVDGAFAAYYPSVASILGPGGGDPDPDPDPTCTDADGDGHCSTATGGDDCDDSNASIHPGANDTKGKNGRNGVDNDCDGVIDG